MPTDMKKYLIIPVIILSCASRLAAQDVKMEILPDKKVLYVNRLGFPGATPVRDVLTSVPELMSRGGVVEFSNFDIQIDGKTTSGGRDVILEQTMISELEKVEITTSPTVDQQQNGQGGVINLVPAKLKDGLSGETFIQASTEWDVMPGVNVNYRNDKLEIRGSFNMEHYRPEDVKYSETYRKDQEIYAYDTVSTRFSQETAKFFLKYTPTKKDEIKAWVWESVQKEVIDNRTGRSTMWDMSETAGKGWMWRKLELLRSGSDVNQVDVSALAEYKHATDFGSIFRLLASYKYNGTRTVNSVDGNSSYTKKPYEIGGEAKFDHVFFNTEKQRLELNSGVNLTFTPSRSDMYSGHNLYLSPFLTFKYRIGDVTFHAGARYQYYGRKFTADGMADFTKVEHDVTANLNLAWKIAPHHSLRFIATRNIIRPGSDKLYPEVVQDRNTGKWKKGNPDLVNSMVHAIDATYVFDAEKNGNSWITSVGLGYDIADNLVGAKAIEYPRPGGTEPDFITTYFNMGDNHILRGNLSTTYRRGIFSILFSGNVFGNFTTDAGVGDNHFYYNIGLTPVFNFRYGWVFSVRSLYNSQIITRGVTYGDALLISLNLSKSFGKWTIYATLSDVFDYLTYDVSKSDGETYISAYDMYPRHVSAGFSYRF